MTSNCYLGVSIQPLSYLGLHIRIDAQTGEEEQAVSEYQPCHSACYLDSNGLGDTGSNFDGSGPEDLVKPGSMTFGWLWLGLA